MARAPQPACHHSGTLKMEARCLERGSGEVEEAWTSDVFGSFCTNPKFRVSSGLLLDFFYMRKLIFLSHAVVFVTINRTQSLSDTGNERY